MRYHLKSNALFLELDSFGASIAGLKFLGKDRVPSFTEAENLKAAGNCCGSVMGRFAGRIGGGRCVVNGVHYALTLNSPPNHLHGGAEGFHFKDWKPILLNENEAVFKFVSQGGDEGYPARLEAFAHYRLENNALFVELSARADQDTVVNLTNHAYFNLSGVPENLEKHELQIYAQNYLPLNADYVPSGEIAPVTDTPFDFTRLKPIGKEIDSSNRQIELAGGYDHCFALDKGGAFCKAATLKYENTVLDIFTDSPGLVVYTANFFSDLNCAAGMYGRRSALALECQNYPDSVNHANFPDCLLKKGAEYKNTIQFVFSEIGTKMGQGAR